MTRLRTFSASEAMRLLRALGDTEHILYAPSRAELETLSKWIWGQLLPEFTIEVVEDYLRGGEEDGPSLPWFKCGEVRKR